VALLRLDRADNIAFYLILNVAVGGTNGFFPDKQGNKPWQDSSKTAMQGEHLSLIQVDGRTTLTL
jgi:hypothetical protein